MSFTYMNYSTIFIILRDLHYVECKTKAKLLRYFLKQIFDKKAWKILGEILSMSQNKSRLIKCDKDDSANRSLKMRDLWTRRILSMYATRHVYMQL